MDESLAHGRIEGTYHRIRGNHRKYLPMCISQSMAVGGFRTSVDNLLFNLSLIRSMHSNVFKSISTIVLKWPSK